MSGKAYARRDADAPGGWRWTRVAAEGTPMTDGEAVRLIGALRPTLYRYGAGAYLTKIGTEE